MPRFILFDNWLADATGHNYQYALDVATAAEERGYSPVLVVRKDLSPDVRFPKKWRIERLFSYGECPRHWIGLDGRNPYPCDLEGRWLTDYARISWWRRCLDIAAAVDRRRRIASYSQSCQKALENCRPTTGDLLFLPSLSDFDFLCAARFWRDHPTTKDFDWHLQFHFNFFIGRDPEFAAQHEILRRFQWHFRAAVDQIPEHRLHFYATSEAVARQYDELGVAIFHVLPYPVRPMRRSDRVAADRIETASASRPLRVTRPGGMRQEKGKKQIESLVSALWKEFLQPGRIQLVFQTTPETLRKRLPAEAKDSMIESADSPAATAPFLTAPHPLTADRYTDLICRSDIGLLAYDARRYFSRVSGVLCEMLSAGVPVIVPAGCWLADQLAEEQYAHFDSLWRRARHESCSEILSANKNHKHVVDTSNASQLLVRWTWPKEATEGMYLQATVRSVGSDQIWQREILGTRAGGAVGFVVAVPEKTAQLELEIGNAFDTCQLDVGDIELIRIPETSAPLPTARVGLTAADETQVPRLINEMIRHFDHYRRTAQEFAGWWQTRHSPTATIEILEARSTRVCYSPRSHVA